MTRLCKGCTDAQEPLKTLTYLVQPEHGAAMVFDIFGMAVCPTCAAIWYRDHNGTILLNEWKPPKRATTVLLKGAGRRSG